MGPTSFHLLFILFVLFQLFCITSAVKVENFTLFESKLTLKAHTANTIPCMFHTRRHLNPLKVQLEWGKIERNEYVPLIHLYGDHVRKASSDYGDKYQVFIPEVSKGNCSLVINPTEITDSGTYQVRLTIVGKLYQPTPSIEVEVVNQPKGESRGWFKKKTTTVPPTTTTMMATKAKKGSAANNNESASDIIFHQLDAIEKKIFIFIIVIGVFLSIAVMAGVLLIIKLRQKSKNGDEEEGEDDESESEDSSDSS
ncbi:uncharacterized protein LOC116411560 isoform X2 [Xenopus tropicalis]|uniref:Uncharacterized protein LOC116411560 isoform X2 n=1 Tax=Xenopus tropicalis TaxID=8364 RepID=A0A8J1JPT2_XENTR|nr:uncharacterized protein LOC116411560 isoform X2 [Xenopus tropicalis]